MKYRLIKKILVLLFFFAIPAINAQEEKFIGLFVYNFTKYFDWPESSKSGDFKIQVLGHESVYNELLRITGGKKIGTQNILVQQIASASEIDESQIVFIGYWHSRFFPEINTKLLNSPTLLITEMEGMLDKGSAINFVIRDGTIKFEMKTSNVTSHQIKTDQRIRELAYRVVE